MLRPPSVAQTFLKLPGRSGMVTARIASRCSPTSASSAMKRRRSKLVFAPEATATKVLSFASWRSTQAFAPAMAKGLSPDLLHRDAVGEEPDLVELDPFPRLERARHGVGIDRLHPDDPD